jgi:hypothetical protein
MLPDANCSTLAKLRRTFASNRILVKAHALLTKIRVRKSGHELGANGDSVDAADPSSHVLDAKER